MKLVSVNSQDNLYEALNELTDYMNNSDKGSMCNLLEQRFESCNYNECSYICSYETKYEFRNPTGSLHGGIIASMLDTAMGCLAISFAGKMTPTISMETSYLHAIPLNDRLYVKSKLTMAGHSLCHVTAEAWMENLPEMIVATAAGVYHIG